MTTRQLLCALVLVLAAGAAHAASSPQTQPVTGTVTANAGSGTFTNQQSNVTVDADTGAGTQTLTLFGVALPASGGAVIGGTATNPFVVSGTVNAAQSGTWAVRAQDGSGNAITSATRGSERALTVQIVDNSGNQITSFGGAGGTASNYGSAFPASGTASGFSDGTNMQGARVFDLDSGAGTQYGVGVNLRRSNSGGSAELLGQTTMANSLPVTVASDQGNIKVDVAACANCAADSSAFTAASSAASTIGGVFNDAIAALTSGQQGAARLTSDRMLFTNLGKVGGAAIALGQTTMAASFPVTIASNQSNLNVVFPSAQGVTQSGTWTMQPGNTANTTPWLVTGTGGTFPTTQSGTWTVQPGNTANTTPWLISTMPATSGGSSTCVLQSAATTNATNCKASAGQLYGYDLVNTTGTIYYLRLYNLSTAPTCSSATGFVRTIPVPAATSGAGIARDISVGEPYGTGLGFCLTGGGSSTDNTSAATGVYLTLHYK